MFHSICRILLVVACGTVCIRSARAEAPEIRLLDPSEGHVGQKFKIVGDHLAKTRSIRFYFGHTSRAAPFRVLSEQELEVTVPENAQRPVEAILVLDHPDGVTVTCPAIETVVREDRQRLIPDQISDQFAFLHVIRGGALWTVSATTVVEEGGIVDSLAATCPLAFVKSGGTIGELRRDSRPDVFCEPGARVRFDEFGYGCPTQIHHVKSIRLAEGVGPFVLQRAPLSGELKQASAPPTIVSVSPSFIHPGDFLTVKGSGFVGVTAVYTIGRTARLSFARVVSDTELRVEIPEPMQTGHAELLVINDLGTAVTLSRVRTPSDMNSYEFRFVSVTRDKVLFGRDLPSAKIAPLVFVESGGTVIGGSATLLVKDGGTIPIAEGMLFHELGASIPWTQTKVRSNTVLVPTIRLNRISTGFEFAE